MGKNLSKATLPEITLTGDLGLLIQTFFEIFSAQGNETKASKRLGVSRNFFRGVKQGKSSSFFKALQILFRLGFRSIIPDAVPDKNGQLPEFEQEVIYFDTPQEFGDPLLTLAYKEKVGSLQNQGWEILIISKPQRISRYNRISFTVKRRLPALKTAALTVI